MTEQPNATSSPVLACGHCAEYEQLNRRAFIKSSLKAAAATLLSPSIVALPNWMPRVRLAAPHVGPRGDTLVCIFLRGGADGLSMVVPHGDEAYYNHRSTLAIARPDDNHAEFRAIDLDSFFGLHPSLGPLHDIYRAGDLAFVHATGSPDDSRSHFEAMALMERGATTDGDYSGWLARHLATLDTDNESVLRAIAINEMLPASLTGAVSATALQSIGDYHLLGREEAIEDVQATLSALYNQQGGLLRTTANQTLAAIEVLNRIASETYQPRGRTYPEEEFGVALRTVAQLIRADAGVEVACVDLGGWDTHAAQGGGEGIMARLMSTLSAGLGAFYEDLQAEIGSVTVVVMSEFGRRVKQNAAQGTDHGHGGVMMVLGGGINGGRVFATWPGLEPEQLAGPGDLAITTDYRDVLSEVVLKRLSNPRVGDVFPGHTFSEVGLAQAR